MRVVLEFAAEQHRDGESLADDVLALGEHRALEARDILDARAEQRRDLVGGQTRADVRLDLARARAIDRSVALALSARLPKLDAQHIVDGERESSHPTRSPGRARRPRFR